MAGFRASVVPLNVVPMRANRNRITNREMVHELWLFGREVEIAMHLFVVEGISDKAISRCGSRFSTAFGTENQIERKNRRVAWQQWTHERSF